MRPRRQLPTQQRLRELLDYDPETGVLTAKIARRSRRGKHEPGDRIGAVTRFGYLVASVDGRQWPLHRVIWKWVTGEEPPAFLDHKNRQRDDNRWENLREATASQNAQNSGVSRINRSGSKGVSFTKATGKWHAAVTHEGQSRFLGQFDRRVDAIAAYEAEANARFGDFACAETASPSVIYEVVEMLDVDFCDDMLNAARAMWATRIDPTVPEPTKVKIEQIGVGIAVALAKLSPERYGHLRQQ